MHAWRQFAKRTYHWPEGAFIDFIISSISFIKARLKGAGARYIQFLFSLISSLSTIAVGTAGETSIGSFSSQRWLSLRCPWMSCASTWHSKWATLFLELSDWHKMGSINSNSVSYIGTHINLAAFSSEKGFPLLQINYFGWSELS
jgi:hypothetical protein